MWFCTYRFFFQIIDSLATTTRTPLRRVGTEVAAAAAVIRVRHSFAELYVPRKPTSPPRATSRCSSSGYVSRGPQCAPNKHSSLARCQPICDTSSPRFSCSPGTTWHALRRRVREKKERQKNKMFRRYTIHLYTTLQPSSRDLPCCVLAFSTAEVPWRTNEKTVRGAGRGVSYCRVYIK